jgi:23S rRNA (uracil1939-C5)-methyltransferase
MAIAIEKIVYPGKSLARIGGKVIFTDQGLPGETVEIAVLKETKKYTQCLTTKIITPSPERQIPSCKHYQACSPYQYINYPYQVEIKKQQLQEILSRQLKIDSPGLKFRSSEQIWGYRNKINLKIIWKDEKPRLAYNLPQAPDKFIQADECFLSPRTTNLFLTAFIETIAVKSLRTVNELVVRENAKNELLVAIYHAPSLSIKSASCAFKDLSKRFPISGLILIDINTLGKTVLWGNDFFKENIAGIDLYIGAESFFQVNTNMLSVLVEDLQNNLDLSADKVLADLYCGIGTFGILLSKKVKRVIGIEAAIENFFFTEKNIKLNNIKNFDVRLCDCKEAINSLLKQKIGLAIVDPPRKGMDITICDALAQDGPPAIAYISCNPATLVRDLKILLSAYEIKNIFSYDFFPHTPHIETMVLLNKK